MSRFKKSEMIDGFTVKGVRIRSRDRFFSIEDISLPQEKWRLVEGYDCYFISNLGRMYKKLINYPQLIKPQVDKLGYKTYQPYNSKTKTPKRMLAHRMVAKAFLSDPPKLRPYVNHKDRNPSNNVLENLEYVSHQENVNHWRSISGPMERYVGAHKRWVLDLYKTLTILTVKEKYRQMDLAKIFNVHKSIIQPIYSGKRPSEDHLMYVATMELFSE